MSSVNESGQRPCPVCGARVNPGDRFCPNCGSPQEWPDPATTGDTVSSEQEPAPWEVETRPTEAVPPPPPPSQEGSGWSSPYEQTAWVAPAPERRNNRTWWILGGLFLLFIAVCCCCAFLVFVAASQDTALREDLEGTANVLLALRAAR